MDAFRYSWPNYPCVVGIAVLKAAIQASCPQQQFQFSGWTLPCTVTYILDCLHIHLQHPLYNDAESLPSGTQAATSSCVQTLYGVTKGLQKTPSNTTPSATGTQIPGSVSEPGSNCARQPLASSWSFDIDLDCQQWQTSRQEISAPDVSFGTVCLAWPVLWQPDVLSHATGLCGIPVALLTLFGGNNLPHMHTTTGVTRVPVGVELHVVKVIVCGSNAMADHGCMLLLATDKHPAPVQSLLLWGATSAARVSLCPSPDDVTVGDAGTWATADVLRWLEDTRGWTPQLYVFEQCNT